MAIQNFFSSNINPLFYSSSTKGTILTAGIALATWYYCDPTTLIAKIGIVFLGALALESNTLIPHLQRQAEITAIGTQELKKWEAFLAIFKKSNVEKELGKPNVNYSDFSNKVHEDGKQWNTAEEYRSSIQEGSKQVLKNIVEKHIPQNSKILEIGSNALDKNGNSYLARLLPQERLKNSTYSDYISSVVSQEAPKTKRTYKWIDIRNPEQTLSNSQDCLIAINVADVISRHDFPRFAMGAYQLLKDEGHMVILADRPIEPTPLFAKFSKEAEFAFPWIEKFNALNTNASLLKGVKVIPIDAIRQIFDSLGEEYKPFFDELMSLKPPQRHHFLKQSFFAGLDICQFLQLLTENHPQCQSYDRTESYQNDVTATFKSHKFEVLFSGYMEGSKIVNHTDLSYKNTGGNRYNKLNYDPRHGGPLTCENIEGIKPRELQVTANFHVMIFKKKSVII